MNQNFIFPVQKAPIPRPAACSSASSRHMAESTPGSRDSNALRASILDAALQLGLGTSSIVADWIFNNPISEEDELFSSPSLTHASSATSEESFHSPYARTNFPSAVSPFPLAQFRDNRVLCLAPAATSPQEKPAHLPPPAAPLTIFDSFPVVKSRDIPLREVPHAFETSSRGKLKKKKKKKKVDGYESDGGYASDVRKKREKKETESSKHGPTKDLKERLKPSLVKEEKFTDRKEERQIYKSLTSVNKARKKYEDKDTWSATGYETDGILSLGKKKTVVAGRSMKSKTLFDPGDAGSETDAGYLSSSTVLKKSKTRFFKLNPRPSRPDLPSNVTSSPAIRERIPIIPTPIAAQFSTMFDVPIVEVPQSGVSTLLRDLVPSSATQLSSTATSSPPSASVDDRPITETLVGGYVNQQASQVLKHDKYSEANDGSATFTSTPHRSLSSLSLHEDPPPILQSSALPASPLLTAPLRVIKNTRSNPITDSLTVPFGSPTSTAGATTPSRAPSPIYFRPRLTSIASPDIWPVLATRESSSPSRLSHAHDIPPPTPPPLGPLPNVPATGTGRRLIPSSIQYSRLATRVLSSDNDDPLAGAPQLQRGRGQPFPSRPIYPLFSHGPTQLGIDQSRDSISSGISPSPTVSSTQISKWSEDNLCGVLERFDSSEADDYRERAVDSRRSCEVQNDHHESFSVSEYYGNGRHGEDTDGGGSERNSRWSGSVYSCSSVLGRDNSAETRDRFLQRVKAMN